MGSRLSKEEQLEKSYRDKGKHRECDSSGYEDPNKVGKLYHIYDKCSYWFLCCLCSTCKRLESDSHERLVYEFEFGCSYVSHYIGCDKCVDLWKRDEREKPKTIPFIGEMTANQK